MQVCWGNANLCCPVVWPLRDPNEIDCLSSQLAGTNVRLVRLAHFNTSPKPTDHDSVTGYGAKLTQIRRPLKGELIWCFDL